MKYLIYSILLVGATCSALAQVTGTSRVPFAVTITALKPEFKLGEPAMIHIVMKSISQQPFEVPEERKLGRGEMNYRIMVAKIDGSSVPDSDFIQKRKAGHAAGEHSVMGRELSYGDEIEEDADVNNSVNISAPGDYVVQVERVDYQWGALHVRSNKLVIHIAP